MAHLKICIDIAEHPLTMNCIHVFLFLTVLQLFTFEESGAKTYNVLCSLSVIDQIDLKSVVTPVFIICRDRVSYLPTILEALTSLERLSPYAVVLLDHGSTYPPMVDYLQDLHKNLCVKRNI